MPNTIANTLGAATANLGQNTADAAPLATITVPKPVKRAPGIVKRNLNTKPAAKTAPAKPITKNAKPAKASIVTKPAKPAVSGDAAATALRTARAELRTAEREAVSLTYAGDSKTVHRNAGTKLSAILDRIAHPTKAYNETERTGSLAARIAVHVCGAPNRDSDIGGFLSVGCDLGVIAMLASGGILSVKNGSATLANRAKLKACIVASLGTKHVPSKL